MRLYEINEKLEQLLTFGYDSESVNDDGEIDEDLVSSKIKELEISKDEKIEGYAIWLKSVDYDIKELKEEEKKLSERRLALEKLFDSRKSDLATYLECDKKFTTSKVVLSFRKSTSVEVDENFVEWAKENNFDYLTFKDPTPNKTAIKEAIKNGEIVEHANLKENFNLIIK